MTPLMPRPVASGWLRRWGSQGTDLWRRSPATVILGTGVFAGVATSVPEFGLLDIPVAMVGAAVIFCGSRALDHQPAQAIPALYRYLREAVVPILLLARDVFLVYFVVFFALFTLHVLLEAAVASAHLLLPESPATTAYRALPQWIRAGARREESLIYIAFFTPVIAPLVYLTLLAGNHPVANFLVAFRAVAINWKPSVAFLCASWLGSAGLHATLRLFPQEGYGAFLLVLNGLVFCALGTAAYLWCREMFEGKSENAPQGAKNSVGARATAIA